MNAMEQSLPLASSQQDSRLVGSMMSITNLSFGGRMPEQSKSLGQTYYEEVEVLKAKGVSNADAIRAVAEKYGKNENAIRGGLHQYKSKHVDGGGGTTTRRTRRGGAPSVDDLMASAKQSLESALAIVDAEVEQAKTALDAAQVRYDEAVASVKDRKADIEKKLKALA